MPSDLHNRQDHYRAYGVTIDICGDPDEIDEEAEAIKRMMKRLANIDKRLSEMDKTIKEMK